MTEQEKQDLEQRIFFAASPWRELLAWLNESRENGWKLPEDREAYVGKLVLLASDLSGVVSRDRSPRSHREKAAEERAWLSEIRAAQKQAVDERVNQLLEGIRK